MYVKIIDKLGKEMGCIDKKYLVSLKLRHQIARVIVYARDSKTVLLQQRSLSDPSCPGMWDTSSSGHVDGHEEPRHAAMRELREELSVTTQENKLKYVGSFDTSIRLNEGKLERETHIYTLTLDEETKRYSIDQEEVEQACWVKLKCIPSSINLTDGAAQSLELFKKTL